MVAGRGCDKLDQPSFFYVGEGAARVAAPFQAVDEYVLLVA